MKTTLRAKLLQHIVGKKKANEGFTLIELLVVIIIIGILAAIALPSFLNQANKAKQTEAATNIGAVNRGQQAYFLENDEFSTSVSAVGVGIKAESERYKFGNEPDFASSDADKTVARNGTGLDTAGDFNVAAGVYGAPENPDTLKGYTGIAYILIDPTTNDATSTVELWEGIEPGDAPALTLGITAGAAGSSDKVNKVSSTVGKRK